MRQADDILSSRAHGTQLVSDLIPGPMSSGPTDLTVAGDLLFFSATDMIHGRQLWVYPLRGAPCVADTGTLCIDNQPGDQRFEVSVQYHTAQGGGLAGDGHAISLKSLGLPGSGVFSFFSSDNPEMLVKILNGCALNQHFWVFYAAGTNVGLVVNVRDTRTGITRTYRNADQHAAAPVQDAAAFSCSGAAAAVRTETKVAAAATASEKAAIVPEGSSRAGNRSIDFAALPSASAPCVPSSTSLCIDDQPGDKRFKITVSYSTSQGGGLSGSGTPIPLASVGVSQGGIFWFFSAANPEMLIKVLNGCSINQEFWVFFSATTNVGFTVTVTDTFNGHFTTYTNNDLTPAAPVQDAAALSCT